MDLNEYKQLKTNEFLLIEVNDRLKQFNETKENDIIDQYTLFLIENDLLK